MLANLAAYLLVSCAIVQFVLFNVLLFSGGVLTLLSLLVLVNTCWTLQGSSNRQSFLHIIMIENCMSAFLMGFFSVDEFSYPSHLYAVKQEIVWNAICFLLWQEIFWHNETKCMFVWKLLDLFFHCTCRAKCMLQQEHVIGSMCPAGLHYDMSYTYTYI